MITGYDSADGTHWTQVGTVTLSGLPPRVVQAGLFAASPVDTCKGQDFAATSTTGLGGPTQATGVFDHVERRLAGDVDRRGTSERPEMSRGRRAITRRAASSRVTGYR